MRSTIYLLAALAFSACRTTSGNEGAKTSGATVAPSPALGDAREATVRARMLGHEKLGEAMRDAVARGDLDEARAEAKLLAETRIVGPGGGLWSRMLDATRAAAVQIASD